MKSVFRYYFSPISLEALDAIIRLCDENNIGMCCSTGQVGPTSYTGISYEVLRARTFGHNIAIERDHLGRNGEDLTEWTERDIAHGFTGTMLHIFDQTEESKVLMSKYPTYEWQIGPGEDSSQPINDDLWKARQAVWHSFPTGCLIKGLGNTNDLHTGEISVHSSRHRGIKLRAHNCDYLPQETIKKIRLMFDGMNVAPQIGVVQSMFYLSIARKLSLPILHWENACWSDTKNQARWPCQNHQVTQTVGHYHFSKIEWRYKYYEQVVDWLYNFMKGIIEC